ncbi:Uncharacterised protein [uncultured archaeon]|nr:Uncharacterised protein [uncultured archaeon]
MADEKTGLEDVSEMREITIRLDTYDDIFSDFDPRPFSQRELSEDFLKEVQRRYLEDKRGRYEVHFTIPSSERDMDEEALIKRRLREHFSFMKKQAEAEIHGMRQRGYIYIVLGALVLLADAFAVVMLQESNLVYKILSIMLVPAGWYGMWTGIEKVIDEPASAAERRLACEKFEKAAYIFMSDELE